MEWNWTRAVADASRGFPASSTTKPAHAGTPLAAESHSDIAACTLIISPAAPPVSCEARGKAERSSACPACTRYE